MEDTDARALLSRLLEDEPPPPDTRPFILKAHRDTARRSWAYAGASVAATAAVVAGALVAPGLLPGQARPPGGQAGAPGAVTTSVKPAKPKVVHRQGPSTESPAAAAARLTDALAAAYPLPPGTELLTVPATIPGPPLHFYPSQGGYKAIADVKDALGTGNVFVDVAGQGVGSAGNSDMDTAAAGCRHDTDWKCRWTAAGDLVMTAHQTNTNPGVVVLMVQVFRTDGTRSIITASNVGENSVAPGKNPPPVPPQRSEPVLTTEQMTAIVLSPGLSYYP